MVQIYFNKNLFDGNSPFEVLSQIIHYCGGFNENNWYDIASKSEWITKSSDIREMKKYSNLIIKK